ncbi:MAG TPA: ABC transporter permease [Streptosporangiaceae bacterium]|jgi:ABC-2 type transport system permease protein
MTATTIHDIGYRHYGGPRLGRGYAIRSLYSNSLRGVFGLGRPGRAKVLPFALFALMCIPALVSVAVRLVMAKLVPTAPPINLFPYRAYIFDLQAISAIFLAAQSPQMVSRDLRFHVMPLYLSRPIRRFDYILAKLAAMFSALLIVFAAPLTLLYLGALLNKMNAWDQLTQYGPALGGAVVYALVLAAFGLCVASLTPRRGFGVAAIIALYLVSYGAVSILQGILVANTYDSAAGYVGLLSPYTLVEGFQTWALRQEHTGIGYVEPGAGGAVFVVVVVAVLAAALGILVARYRKVAS